MIKMRLSGTSDELAQVLPIIRQNFQVLRESQPTRTQIGSSYWRIIIDIAPLRTVRSAPQKSRRA